MSNDIIVTICGFTGTSPELRYSSDGNRPWAQFRLASTPSLRDADGKWREGETTWLTVKAFGRLAENVCYSVRKPDPLIVSGRLRTEAWVDRDGNPRTALTLIADAVGHDLTFGKASFARVLRTPSEAAAEGVREGDVAAGVGGAAPRTYLGVPTEDKVSREFSEGLSAEAGAAGEGDVAADKEPVNGGVDYGVEGEGGAADASPVREVVAAGV